MATESGFLATYKKLKKKPIQALKNLLLSTGIASAYLCLFIFFQLLCLTAFINLNHTQNLKFIQTGVDAVPALIFIEFFLFLGTLFYTLISLERGERFTAFFNLPIFRLLILSILPGFVLYFYLKYASEYWFISYLLVGIINIWFLPALINLHNGNSLLVCIFQNTPEQNSLKKQFFKDNWLGFLTGTVLFTLFYFLMNTLDKSMEPSPVLWGSLILNLLLLAIHVYISFQIAIDDYHVLEQNPNPPISKKGVSALILLSTVMTLGLVLLNQVYQAKINGLFKDLDARIVAQKSQNKYERPVLRGKALPGNGADAYWQLIGKRTLKESNKVESFFQVKYPALAKALSDDKLLINTETGIPSLPQVTSKYWPAIHELQNASQYEFIHHDYDFSVDAPLPNFIYIQDLSRIMISIAKTECDQGHCLSGGELLMDTLRLGQDLQYRGTLIDAMVGFVLKNYVVQNGIYRLDHKSLKFKEFQVLLSRMETLIASEKNLKNTIVNEFFTVEKIMQEVNQNDLKALGEMAAINLNSFTNFEALLTRFSFLPIYQPMIIDAFEKLKILKEGLLAVYNAPQSQQNEASEQYLKNIEKTIGGNFFLEIAMPFYGAVWEREKVAKVKLYASYLYLALEAYHLKNGRYPETLSALTPNTIANLPLDPWTNKPFDYELLPNGDYYFYSLGKNATKEKKAFNYLDFQAKNCKSGEKISFSNRLSQVPPGAKSDKVNCEKLNLLAP
jgi:hypothetical protein